MGRNPKPDMTVDEHVENITLNGKNLALYAILTGVGLAALHKNAGETAEVSGMETLLADLVQTFSFNGVGNAGFDHDLSKSTAVIKSLMDEALEKLAAAEPPVCEEDTDTPLTAINGRQGKVLICMACGGSWPVLGASGLQDWNLAWVSQSKPPAVEPTTAPEPELLKCVDDGIAMEALEDAAGKMLRCATCGDTVSTTSDEDMKAWNAAWAAQNA